MLISNTLNFSISFGQFFAKSQIQKFSRSTQKSAKYQNFIQKKIYPRKVARKKLNQIHIFLEYAHVKSTPLTYQYYKLL